MAIRKVNRAKPWVVYWKDPATGKQRSKAFEREEDAKKEESLLKHRLRFERDSFTQEELTDEQDSTAPTLGQVFLLYLKDKQFDQKTCSNKLSNLRWILRRVGGSPVTELSRALIADLIKEMRADLHVTDATLFDRFSLLRTILRWGYEHDVCPQVERPKLPSANDARFVPPSVDELQKMLDSAEPHIQRVIILGSQMGVRVGTCELFQLTWDDVDLPQRILRVHGSKKNENAPWREVPIRRGLVPTFELWRKEDLANGSTYLISYHGKPVTSIKTAWDTALRRAGIVRRIRPYDLRHAFATEAIAAGVDIGTVANLMGHSSPQMLLKHYQYVMDQQKRSAVEALPTIGMYTQYVQPD